jgi:hypothetical protein
MSQPYAPPWSVTGIDLPFFMFKTANLPSTHKTTIHAIRYSIFHTKQRVKIISCNTIEYLLRYTYAKRNPWQILTDNYSIYLQRNFFFLHKDTTGRYDLSIQTQYSSNCMEKKQKDVTNRSHTNNHYSTCIFGSRWSKLRQTFFTCTVKHKTLAHVIIKQQLHINRRIRSELYKSNTKEMQSSSLLNKISCTFIQSHTYTPITHSPLYTCSVTADNYSVVDNAQRHDQHDASTSTSVFEYKSNRPRINIWHFRSWTNDTYTWELNAWRVLLSSVRWRRVVRY